MLHAGNFMWILAREQTWPESYRTTPYQARPQVIHSTSAQAFDEGQAWNSRIYRATSTPLWNSVSELRSLARACLRESRSPDSSRFFEVIEICSWLGEWHRQGPHRIFVRDNTVGSRSRRLGLAGCELAASESGARVGGCVCHLRAGFWSSVSTRSSGTVPLYKRLNADDDISCRGWRTKNTESVKTWNGPANSRYMQPAEKLAKTSRPRTAC